MSFFDSFLMVYYRKQITGGVYAKMKTATTTERPDKDKPYYIISDAAKELHVESHVLRYWEEELSLKIPRNDMGHRIYGPKEMELFHQIIKWKEKGLSLKEIHTKCNPSTKISETTPERSGHHQVIPYPVDSSIVEVSNDTGDDIKMVQFKQILGRIVSDAIRDNSEELTTDIAHNVSEHVNKELDFLFREKEDADEKRFRRLDETIRSFQKARQEAAAAEINEYKTKHKLRRQKRNAKKNPV